jgi:CubicO group peptidase (beta-lactamase class C family)
MDTGFRSVCEAAAERWSVPALVVATGNETVSVGCDAATRFRIASITKPMTAFVVSRLLDLEAPTGIWPDDVRVRHLLAHTSGFDGELPDGDNGKYGDGDDALERCVGDLGEVRRFLGADTVWSYANAGYWLAAHLAALRADTTFEEAMARHVLGPAGLEATDFDEPDVQGTGEDALTEPYPRSRRPSGGLVSNVGDLARFAEWFLEKGSAQRVVLGKPIGGVYGLGLFGERVGGVDVWGHSGSYGGFQSQLLTVPSRNAVFVGLTNASNGAKALAEIEDAFFERVVGAPRTRPPFVDPAPDELGAFAGTYENSSMRFEVEAVGTTLVVRIADAEIVGRKFRERGFRVPDGPHVNERFDFPLEGFARLGSRLAVRV